jgi:hypothetical protein
VELLPILSSRAQPKTAFVFAGGGSFGAIQVGMLHALAAHGIVADVVFGSLSSPGAADLTIAADPICEKEIGDRSQQPQRGPRGSSGSV